MHETAKETLMYRTVLWTLREREGVGNGGAERGRWVGADLGMRDSKRDTDV